MAQTLDTTVYKLTRNISVNKTPRIKEIQFGDGYKHIMLDGINYDVESWNLDFVPMDSTTVLLLESLLVNSVNGTANYLSWTPPTESTTKYWTASNINKSIVSFDLWKITCTLTREFILS